MSDTDYDRQICSGMWGGKNTYINGELVAARCWSIRMGLDGYMQVTFAEESQGQLAMVIYEWTDMTYLGKVTSHTDEYMPVSGIFVDHRTHSATRA